MPRAANDQPRPEKAKSRGVASIHLHYAGLSAVARFDYGPRFGRGSVRSLRHKNALALRKAGSLPWTEFDGFQRPRRNVALADPPKKGIPRADKEWFKKGKSPAPAARKPPGHTRPEFKAAAKAVTTPAPKPAAKKSTKRKQRRSDSQCFNPIAIVEKYLALCRRPSDDLQGWLREDRKKPFRAPAHNAEAVKSHRDNTHERRSQVRAHDHHRLNDKESRHGHDLRTKTICDHTLQGVLHGLDPELRGRQGDFAGHRVSTRPGGGLGTYDELRSLRASRGVESFRGNSDGHAAADRSGAAAPSNVGSELAAAMGEFASRIAAIAGQTVSREERELLIRAIKDQQTISKRAIIQRHKTNSQNENQKPREAPDRPNKNWMTPGLSTPKG